jgi:hypothetical protein
MRDMMMIARMQYDRIAEMCLPYLSILKPVYLGAIVDDQGFRNQKSTGSQP